MGLYHSRFDVGSDMSVKISGYDIVIVGHEYFLHQPKCKCCSPVTFYLRQKRIPFKYLPFEQLSFKCKFECLYLCYWKGFPLVFINGRYYGNYTDLMYIDKRNMLKDALMGYF